MCEELDKCYGTDGTFVRVRYKNEAGKQTSIGEYQSYMMARNRSTNKGDPNYKPYGGKGIEFRFNTFASWWNELGKRPTPYHSVDRIDNEGHYEKGNVRWASKKEQAVNRQIVHAVMLTYPNGDNVLYESAQAAARYVPLSVEVIRSLCRGQNTNLKEDYKASFNP
jgi:hypothetical protein|tara:strand:+ start:39 stop:536 length:498 start_codon:yes stop_codon:yes gene_type:complete